MVLGLELLLELLESSIVKHQRDASAALYKLANEASSLSHIDAAPPSPVSQVFFWVNLFYCAMILHIT